MSYIVVVIAAVAGVLCVGITYNLTNKRFRNRRDRSEPVEARRLRTPEEQALALAFAALYRRCANKTSPHFVLPEDRELVATMVRSFLRENRDTLGEMYLGPTVRTN